jgi:RNA polymerase sigma-70 factor, ECF subfamily
MDPRSLASRMLPEPRTAASTATGNELALLAALRGGDESACEALYLAHHDALWRFAYGQVKSAEVAEDLVQEVFLALWRDRAELEVMSSVRAWLYGAVRNQVLKHLRHQRVVARLSDRTGDHSGLLLDANDSAGSTVAMGAAPPDAHAELEAKELDAAIAEAIAALPERRRIAMTLRWRHSLTAPEIARVLETSPEAVRVLLSRARQELVALLRRVRG